MGGKEPIEDDCRLWGVIILRRHLCALPDTQVLHDQSLRVHEEIKSRPALKSFVAVAPAGGCVRDTGIALPHRADGESWKFEKHDQEICALSRGKRKAANGKGVGKRGAGDIKIQTAIETRAGLAGAIDPTSLPIARQEQALITLSIYADESERTFFDLPYPVHPYLILETKRRRLGAAHHQAIGAYALRIFQQMQLLQPNVLERTPIEQLAHRVPLLLLTSQRAIMVTRVTGEGKSKVI